MPALYMPALDRSLSDRRYNPSFSVKANADKLIIQMFQPDHRHLGDEVFKIMNFALMMMIFFIENDNFCINVMSFSGCPVD